MADEVPQERELVLGEEAGLDVVEDDGVIAVESSAVLGKPSLSSASSSVSEADQDRLIGRSAESASGWSKPSKGG